MYLTKDYLNILTLNNYSLANKVDINSATRITELSSTLIDHVICTYNIKNRCSIRVKDSCLSDHKELFIELKEKINKYVPKVEVKRTILNVDKFKQKFSDKIEHQVIHFFQQLITLFSNAKR